MATEISDSGIFDDDGEFTLTGSRPQDIADFFKYDALIDARGNPDKIASKLSGTTKSVFANGKRLFDADLKAVGNSGFNDFELMTEKDHRDYEWVQDTINKYPDINNIRDVFRSLDITEVTFKPVEKAKQKVPDNFEGSLPGPDVNPVKERVKSMNLGLILPVVAVLGLVYLVVSR